MLYQGSLRWALVLAVAAVVSNGTFLLVYLPTIDWQPQGRYLWPSWLAMAVLASAAMNRWWPERQLVAPALMLSALLLVMSLAVLIHVF